MLLTHLRRTLAGAALLLALAPAPAAAQGAARAFSLFVDCSDFYCDPDFYRTEIAFADHVRERTAADVHVLVTRQATGGGGTSFTLAFYGQRRFAGVSDTLSTNTAQGATEDDERQAIARTVKLGLARYLARTAEAARTTIAVAAATKTDSVATPTRDPWNAWVFRAGVNINASRERDYKSDYVYGTLSASRVTERWKTMLQANSNYDGQQYSFGADTTTSIRRDYSGSVLQVKSLGEHWSAGVNASAGSSTYYNQSLFASLAPAVEYNVYPYKESTRHALRFLYSVGMKHFRYNDTTVYFRTEETRPFEQLAISLSQKQKWGSLSADLTGFHYLDDLSKSRLTFAPSADVRIVKGLSLNLFGYYTVLHDQIFLPKGSATREEVLLRQSQLATTYSAYMYMGLSYTFGSVLNNVVNPRFGR